MPINFNLSKYSCRIFIETGTLNGEGVDKALVAGFEKIYSIELDEKRFTTQSKRFEDNDKVTIIHGDSGIELPKLLEKINEPVTFFIDAHFCADDAEIGEKWAPLKEEIQAIKNHHIKTHTILIDDWRCMNNTHVDFSWSGHTNKGSTHTTGDGGKEVGFLGKSTCKNKIKEINSNYKFSFEKGSTPKDVLVCQTPNKE